MLVHTEAKTGQISRIHSRIEWVLYPFLMGILSGKQFSVSGPGPCERSLSSRARLPESMKYKVIRWAAVFLGLL